MTAALELFLIVIMPLMAIGTSKSCSCGAGCSRVTGVECVLCGLILGICVTMFLIALITRGIKWWKRRKLQKIAQQKVGDEEGQLIHDVGASSEKQQNPGLPTPSPKAHLAAQKASGPEQPRKTATGPDSKHRTQQLPA